MTVTASRKLGVELEYMIVDRCTLDVLPISDRVLRAMAGSFQSEVEVGPLNWSNELVLHVLEIKTGEPVSSLNGLASLFGEHIRNINEILKPEGGRLMPTAMHPWMNPDRETRLWPHEYSPIYEALNRIFDCRGHGWSNLQSTHLNLSFDSDEEFGRLHAAIRLLLPLLPTLAASSPIAEGRSTPHLDHRLFVYRNNAVRVPSVTGSVIPEPAFSRQEYETLILNPMFQAMADLDPEAVLRYEWLNARGAIARFDRGSIEIRVLDVQECPQADLAICALVIGVVERLVEETWLPFEVQKRIPVEPLAAIFTSALEFGEGLILRDADYLRFFGIEDCPVSAKEVWGHLMKSCLDRRQPDYELWRSCLEMILLNGTLAARILKELGDDRDRASLKRLYGRLCDCLSEGRMFVPEG